MYDELVKALRGCVLSKPCDGCPYYDPNGPTEKCATMNIAAADAIEELSSQHEAQRENIVVLMDIIENDRKEIEWLKKCVNDLPKPARSKWVNVEVSYVGDMKHNGVENVASMQCQNCKRYHNEVYFFGQVIEHVNYCPNCGARMEES